MTGKDFFAAYNAARDRYTQAKALVEDESWSGDEWSEVVQMYCKTLDDYIRAEQALSNVLDLLTGAERKVIRGRYLDGLSWRALTDKLMYIDRRSTLRLHHSAMLKIDAAYKEIEQKRE